MRRTSLAIVTATAVALSVFSPVAGAQSADAPSIDTGSASSSVPVDENGEPISGNEQWPGSVEGSSMLSSGDLPQAPSFGSSQKQDSDDDGVSDEEQGRIDGLKNLPVIGSIVDPPGWVALPFAVLQAGMAITGFMATAASMMVTINPDLAPVIRDYLRQMGINPDA